MHLTMSHKPSARGKSSFDEDDPDSSPKRGGRSQPVQSMSMRPDNMAPAQSMSMRPALSMSVRKSTRCKDETSSLVAPTVSPIAEEAEEDGGGGDPDASYHKIITEAKRSVGHGGIDGAFPEEWDAQLLVDCGRAASGHRLVLFCPAFLIPILDDADELDRAFRFILLTMDSIAMREKYIFVYCFLGMDWSDPRLAHRLRLAYDYLPRKYAKHLRHFYILHATSAFRLTMWTFWAWISKRFWDKIQYVGTLDELCEKLQPDDGPARVELRRRFPQIVQCHDAEACGIPPPVTFGVPLRQLCNGFGVDFTDKTTGRWYPKLPPAVIFLCEAMEREAADEDFPDLFTTDASDVYRLVETIDQGRPLGRDIPMCALWCALKLFLDCLPAPLLSFQAIHDVQTRGVKATDLPSQRRFLVDIFTKQLPPESAYVALYVASFLHTMCDNAQERAAVAMREQSTKKQVFTPRLAASVFTPAFMRPRVMTQESWEAARIAEVLVETLIDCAEEPELWVGRHTAPRWDKTSQPDSDDSSDDGGGPAAGSKDDYSGVLHS